MRHSSPTCSRSFRPRQTCNNDLEIVRDKYILRQIISAATKSVRRAYEEQEEVDSLLDEVEQKIFDVGEDRFKGQMLSMKDHAMQAIETIEKL